MESIDGENSGINELEQSASKRRRVSSSAGDNMKHFNTFVSEMKESQSKKIELLGKIVDTPAKSELELFFASICKTVEKLTAIEQAKLKMKISTIVSEAEIAFIESCDVLVIYENTTPLNSTPKSPNINDIDWSDDDEIN